MYSFRQNNCGCRLRTICNIAACREQIESKMKTNWHFLFVWSCCLSGVFKHEFHETCPSVTFYFMKKDSKRCCDTTAPESIHTKDESKRGTAFAFIFSVNWLWRCSVTASFRVFFRHIKCNRRTSFMEFMISWSNRNSPRELR